MGQILTSENIMNDISNKILEVLSQSGMDIDDIDFQELVDRQVGAIEKPKVNISINTGSFTPITMNTVYKLSIIVSLFIIVQDLDGEKERRFAINKLIVGIANVLNNQKFGLPLINPFKPLNFSNVTDSIYRDGGYALYELRLSCSFQVDTQEDLEDNQGILLKIVNKYFLNTPNNDGELDLESEIDFSSYNGGGAFSEYTLDPVFGGYAGTKYINNVIYGGKANSTYN